MDYTDNYLNDLKEQLQHQNEQLAQQRVAMEQIALRLTESLDFTLTWLSRVLEERDAGSA